MLVATCVLKPVLGRAGLALPAHAVHPFMVLALADPLPTLALAALARLPYDTPQEPEQATHTTLMRLNYYPPAEPQQTGLALNEHTGGQLLGQGLVSEAAFKPWVLRRCCLQPQVLVSMGPAPLPTLQTLASSPSCCKTRRCRAWRSRQALGGWRTDQQRR